MPSVYHSANRPPFDVPDSSGCLDTRDGSVAFVHDVLIGGLPTLYEDCDILYADLPWQSGFATFNQRAAVNDGRTFAAFMEAIRQIVLSTDQPVVLVSGQHALRHLPSPDQLAPVQMPATRQNALAIFYRLTLTPDWTDTFGLLHHLADRFHCVGDFCCGYGSAAQTFARAGKSFVASDFNPACIGYIAAHLHQWRAAHA